MKKFIALLTSAIACLACLSATACGGNTAAASETQTSPSDTGTYTTQTTQATSAAPITETEAETAATTEEPSEASEELTEASETTVETTTAAAVTTEAATPAPAATATAVTASDLYLNISGAAYTLRSNIDTVFAKLGSDYQYAEAIACDHDGMDKTFTYSSAEFYTWPLPEGDLLCEIYSTSPSAKTSRGVTVGAGKDAVLAAYGSTAEITDSQILYRVGGDTLYFDMQNGVVTGICVTAQPV